MILTNNAWNLIDDVFNNIHRANRVPDVNRNMKLENDVLTMEFDVPGLSKKDINVKVEDRVLSLEGENDVRSFTKKYNISEDWDVSKTSASVKNGVLSVSIPKVEEKKTKVIEVTVK